MTSTRERGNRARRARTARRQGLRLLFGTLLVLWTVAGGFQPVADPPPGGTETAGEEPLLGGGAPLLGRGEPPPLDRPELTAVPLPPSDAQPSDRFPVLLVPGWSDQAADVQPLRRRLLEAGWSAGGVEIVEFADPFGSNESHAREVARAVEVLRARTGAERVDVVAHSMGGLSVRHFLHFEGGAASVRRVAFLGTPHYGTAAAILAWGAGGREMVPGSRFLERLNESGPVPGTVEALALRTLLDLRVIPASSAVLPGASNLEVCCPTHAGMVDDERTFSEVLAFLVEGIPTAAADG